MSTVGTRLDEHTASDLHALTARTVFCDLCGSMHGVQPVGELPPQPTLAGWVKVICARCYAGVASRSRPRREPAG